MIIPLIRALAQLASRTRSPLRVTIRTIRLLARPLAAKHGRCVGFAGACVLWQGHGRTDDLPHLPAPEHRP